MNPTVMRRSVALRACHAACFLTLATIFAACDLIDARPTTPAAADSEDAADAAHTGPHARQPNLVLIILDTVRRDRVQPCGYDKPTTPNLVLLGTQSTTFCRTVTPGSWTAPVHASMLTGLLPSEHGLDYLPVKPTRSEKWADIAKMNPDVETLPEILSEHGYQTALVSANPVVNPTLGLARGFDFVNVNPGGWTEGRALVSPSMGAVLDRLDPDRPLFLTLNIWIAHNPYESVPEEAGWTPPTPLIDLFAAPNKDKSSSIFARYLRNDYDPAEEATLLANIASGYDWGVHLADRDLGRALDLLTERGLLAADTTIVVTSDHGELLGEHRMLDHGGVLYRSNIDVFTMVRGPGFAPGRRIDSLVQSQDIFPTFLQNAGIEVPPTAHAVPLQQPDPNRQAVTMTMRNSWLANFVAPGEFEQRHMVALQEGDKRVLWLDGGLEGQVVPGLEMVEKTASADPELSRRIHDFAEQWQSATRTTTEISDEMRAGLEALGYLQ